jgi:mono/diheme cytochrome c family protein
MASERRWPVRLGFAAGAACVMGVAAGAQSLFESGPVGFSEAQAIRGEAAYRERCAACHGPNLDDGQFAGPLKGAAFKAHWHDQSPKGLWSLIIKRMPPASPGSLGSKTYADIEAYLLRENGDGAGMTELAAASNAPTGGGASAESPAASPRNTASDPSRRTSCTCHAARRKSR